MTLKNTLRTSRTSSQTINKKSKKLVPKSKSSPNNSIFSTLPLIQRSLRFNKNYFNPSRSPYPYNINRYSKRSTIRKAKNHEQKQKEAAILEQKQKEEEEAILEQKQEEEAILEEYLYESNNPIKSIANTDLALNPRIQQIKSINDNQSFQEKLDENIDNNIRFLREKQKETILNKLKKKLFNREKKYKIEPLIYNNNSGSYIPPQSNKGKDIKCRKKTKFRCALARGCVWTKQTKSCNIKKKPQKSICKGKGKKKCKQENKCDWNNKKKKCQLSSISSNNVNKTSNIVKKESNNPDSVSDIYNGFSVQEIVQNKWKNRKKESNNNLLSKKAILNMNKKIQINLQQ